MATTTVRINRKAQERLKQVSDLAGEKMVDVLEKAIDAYWRQQFLHGVADDFAKLRQDPKAWQQELTERQEWDQTLSDGLEEE